MTIPKKFGRYEIIEVIARGGMGVIYKARDPIVDRLVALKVWSAFEPVPEARDRWLRELKRYCVLNHAKIVTAYDIGELDGSTYEAMQLLDGESLDAVIKTNRPLTLLQQIDIISQISGALQFAHEHDIVHRDVKPANIILSQYGEAKLVGLAPPVLS